MASPEELARLRSATGRAAERLFLSLMIKHHEGGIEMAEAILARSERPEVLALATGIKGAQAAESQQMKALLAARADS